MDPSLIVVGLNHRTAPVAVRERFWISEPRRRQALDQLTNAEGVDEVVVLASCNRTEFYLWASDATLAANSALRFLTAEYGLRLCEWKHFYRLVDDTALQHIFRVASSLDSMVLGEPQIVSQFNAAWLQAQCTGSAGRFLDAVMHKALTVSKRVRDETAICNSAVSVPCAAVELAKRTVGSLEDKRVLLLGAGKMSELSARCLLSQGAPSICVINRTFEHAREFAAALGGTAAPLEELRQRMVEADIVISSTSCPHFILSRDEAESSARARQGRQLVLIDMALPRDIHPAVRETEGLFLFDLDDLERAVQHHTAEREAAVLEAQKIVEAEAVGFRRKLLSEPVVPTIVALRTRLNELCRQELESFKHECGPFSRDQDALFGEVTARIIRKIAGSLARELKGISERAEPEQMTETVLHQFHSDRPEKATAGTRH